jgi:7 transmembrane receptor (rhodopsin family)
MIASNMSVSWINLTDTLPLDTMLLNESIRVISVSPSLLAENATALININLTLLTNQQQQQIWITTASRVIPLYSIIFLLAVIGNALVIMTLVQNKRMRTITNLFLLNLAISDLLLGIFCMPITLVGMLLRDFIFGEIMCKLLPYLQGE